MSSYKKIKSTIMVPEDTYKETRILAIRRGMDIGSLVDEALREKIVRDYQQMGLQPPFPQTQTQPPPRHEEPVVHSSRYEAAKSMSKSATQSQEKVSLEYSLLLPGLEFPANKDEMKECAKKVKYPEEDQATMNITLGLLRRLPDYKYTSKNKLEQDFSYMLKQLLKYLEGRVVTIVYTEPISPEQIEKAVLTNARVMKNVNTKTR